MSSERQTGRLIDAEYHSNASPPSSTEYCLYITLFYRPHLTHHHPGRAPLDISNDDDDNDNNTNDIYRDNLDGDNPQLPQALRFSPFLFQSDTLPVPPGLCNGPPQRRIRSLSPRYTLFRLVYEHAEQRIDGGITPPLREYKLFLLTATSTFTPIRGIYFHVAGTPADPNGMTYIETVGSLPEKQRFYAAPPPTSHKPRRPLMLRASTPMGTVAPWDFARFRNLCRRMPAPPCQFDGDRPMLAWAPRRHSREWAQDVIRLTNMAQALDVGVRDGVEGSGSKGISDILNLF